MYIKEQFKIRYKFGVHDLLCYSGSACNFPFILSCLSKNVIISSSVIKFGLPIGVKLKKMKNLGI